MKSSNESGQKKDVVLDTNIFISGTFWEGDSYQVLELWRNDEIRLVISEEIIDEILRIFSGFKIQLSQEGKEKLMNQIRNKSLMIEPTERFNVVLDVSDNKFLECAVGHASFVITNDKHLLSLKEFRGVRMVTPREFLRKVYENS